MKHFEISKWTDFARGVTAGADDAAMKSHLATGCERCQATLDIVQRVAASARRATAYEPPADVVRWAKAISAMQQPVRSSGFRLIPRLLYNSLADAIPAGMRAEDRTSRQALYEAGDFVLDLRVEHEKGSPVVTLVGQVTDRLDPSRVMSRAPVLLLSSTKIVAHAVANRFGEFQMDYAPVQHLRLYVSVDPDGRRIELPLKLLQAETLTRFPQRRSVSLGRLTNRKKQRTARTKKVH